MWRESSASDVEDLLNKLPVSGIYCSSPPIEHLFFFSDQFEPIISYLYWEKYILEKITLPPKNEKRVENRHLFFPAAQWKAEH